ncbi:MAG: UPF0149 family protein [Gammaproteobacteria bacterium]|nr:UPF0149 family protein [Gammaproteobacteria bacterium]
MAIYEELTDLLTDCGLPIDAAEAHGLVSGLVCATQEGDVAEMLRGAFSQYGLDSPKGQTVVGHLSSLHQQTRELLEEAMGEFILLLPDEDNEELDRQTDVLAGWCRGFLYGLVEGGIIDLGHLPGDAGEIVKDLLKISEVVPDNELDSEGQERALTELVEYVRTGVQLIYEEMQPDNNSKQPKLIH